jgi:GGDEF domain-containing protein
MAAWYDAVDGLDLGEWLSLLGLLASLFSLVLAYVGLYRQVRRSSIRVATREFMSLARKPRHIMLAIIVLGGSAYLIVRPPQAGTAALMVLVPVIGMMALLFSFFLAQSRQVSGALIVNEMKALSRLAQTRHNGVTSAVRFDIDRLKAVANYSLSLGERIQETVSRVIHDEVALLRRAGLEIVSFDVPGEDEVLVIGAGLSMDEAAAFADRVRARVKQDVARIPEYGQAVEFIMSRMQEAPSRDEERGGIGTVSAGVAGDRGRAEIWFSDVSAAVKESKTHGRNKTVVYRPGQASEIRGVTGPK